jgi:hypothetical protein
MANSVENVYDTVLGDALMDDTNYPDSIIKFLAAEKEVAAYVSESFSTLVELGCHTGFYVETAIAQGLRYIGVDSTPKYIEIARRRFGESPEVSFVCENAFVALNTISWNSIEKPILFFPFNSFGNIYTDLQKAKEVFTQNIPILISLFKTDDKATSARMAYYKRSGLQNLHVIDGDDTICVSADDGFLSAAFNRSAMVRLSRSAGFRLTVFDMSEVGACYFFDPSSL